MRDSAGQTASGSPVVYEVAPGCDAGDLEPGTLYHATVDGIVDYGVFVELSDGLSGLIHESNIGRPIDTRDAVIVELTEIRDNGDLSFVPVDLETYTTERVDPDYDVVAVADLAEHEGGTVHLEGRVVGVKQTAGPTLLHLADGTGVVPCAAFETAGARAYPGTDVDDVVHVVGIAQRGDHGLQIEVDDLEGLGGDRLEAAETTIADALDETATPAAVDPLVEWSTLEAMWPDLEAVAERLMRAVLEGRPVLVRHHADTDGICGSLPLERAVEAFIEGTHHQPEAARYGLRRLPSKAPFYEFEDVTRDLSRALTDRQRHGRALPLVVMIDNGSTAEDVPAYEQLATYDVPVIVIDHHHPDPAAVEPYVVEHVNPYLHDSDYRVTVGMLCVELARMIDPESGDGLDHVPAVAGLADRSAADAMADYRELAAAAGYDEDRLNAVGDAVDYAAHWLRYDAGRGLMAEVLGVDRTDRHAPLVTHLADLARRDIERQLEAVLPHVEERELETGVSLFSVDLDRHAHRFTYPPPGKTTGAIHDHMVRERGEPAITMGYGPDFVVLRSDGVRLDIPRMVTDLNDRLAGAGVSGGGHLVVGSLRFVEGMREAVLEALVDEMAAAAIDESLTATGPRDYRRSVGPGG